MSRNSMRAVVLTWMASAAVCLGNGTLQAQDPSAASPAASPNVLNLPAGTKSPAASIEQLAWIAGNWEGEAMEGRFEETWNPPSAGTMVGMFKFVQEDEVKFYELQTIVTQGDSLVLRIKHFREDLVGWEEKDRSVEFPLVKISENEAYFSGLTYRKISDDEIQIFVRIGDNEKAKEVKFVCRRVGAKR